MNLTTTFTNPFHSSHSIFKSPSLLDDKNIAQRTFFKKTSAFSPVKSSLYDDDALDLTKKFKGNDGSEQKIFKESQSRNSTSQQDQEKLNESVIKTKGSEKGFQRTKKANTEPIKNQETFMKLSDQNDLLMSLLYTKILQDNVFSNFNSFGSNHSLNLNNSIEQNILGINNANLLSHYLYLQNYYQTLSELNKEYESILRQTNAQKSSQTFGEENNLWKNILGENSRTSNQTSPDIKRSPIILIEDENKATTLSEETGQILANYNKEGDKVKEEFDSKTLISSFNAASNQSTKLELEESKSLQSDFSSPIGDNSSITEEIKTPEKGTILTSFFEMKEKVSSGKRRANKWQLSKEQQEEVHSDPNNQSNQIKNTRVGQDFQASIPKFKINLENPRQRIVKLKWDPENLSQERFEGFMKQVNETLEEKALSNEKVMKLLIEFEMDMKSTIQHLKSNKLFYKNHFKVNKKLPKKKNK